MIKELCSTLELIPDKGPHDGSEVCTYKIRITTLGLTGEDNKFLLSIIDTDRTDELIAELELKEEEAKLISSFFKYHIY